MDPFYYLYYKKITNNISYVQEPNQSPDLGQLKTIPAEVWELIFRKLQPCELLGSAKVCRMFACLSAKLLKEGLIPLMQKQTDLINEKISEKAAELLRVGEASLSNDEIDYLKRELRNAGFQAPSKDGTYPPIYYDLNLPYPREIPENADNDGLGEYWKELYRSQVATRNKSKNTCCSIV
jgi:hypothetical protein